MDENSQFKHKHNSATSLCSRRLMFNALVIFLCSCIGSYIGLMVATTKKSQEIRKRYLDGDVRLETPQIVNSYNIESFGQIGYEIEDNVTILNQTENFENSSFQNSTEIEGLVQKLENSAELEILTKSETNLFPTSTTPAPITTSLFGSIHFLDHYDTSSSVVCCYGSNNNPGSSFKFAPEDRQDFMLFSSQFENYKKSSEISSTLKSHITPQLVTAISEKYFNQHINNMKYFMKHFPNRKIVVYDLGLTREQAFYLYTSPSYYYRHFDFVKYPSHVRDLSNFAWKAFLWAEVLSEFGAIAWFDADTVFVEDFDAILEKYVKNKENQGKDSSCILFYSEQSNFTNLEKTSEQVLKYFPMKKDSNHILLDRSEILPEIVSSENGEDEVEKVANDRVVPSTVLNVNQDQVIQYSSMFQISRKKRQAEQEQNNSSDFINNSNFDSRFQLQAGAVILYNSNECRTNIIEWLLICAATV